MLNTLTVWNFALLEHIQIEFDKGLNILTGETGAGKSILIDALGAMLGNRLSTDFIRTGCEWLRVEAVFSLENQPKVEDFLQSHAIDSTEGELIITRQITSNGRGSILINGCHTTLAVLKKLGSLLVDIHGQNENLALLKPENQFALVDGANGEIVKALAAYKEKYSFYKEQLRLLEEKRQASAEYSQRLDMLRWQIQEIEAANLTAGEDDELEKEISKLANAEKIAKCVNNACELLYGDGRSLGVVSGLEEAVESLKRMSSYDDSLEQTINALNEAAIQIKEASYEVRDYSDEMEFDPRLLDKLQSRMDVIEKLRRKYGASAAEVLEYLAKAQEELNDIESFDEIMAELQDKADQAKNEAMDLAKKLSSLRCESAKSLAGSIEGHLIALGMPDASFTIAVNAGGELGSNGIDNIELLFSANPGQEPGPIQKIASGGELSRIALAIKTVTASRDNSPASMVFDEIDTGIGGKTAQMVAERIAMVASGKQVLCITHLPQIACMADNHLYISKAVTNGKTATSVRVLSSGEQVNEIARMASGADVTAASLDNAREMLSHARAKKELYKRK